MEVIQVLFEVPIWVQIGLNDGTFKLFGGVVRNSKGAIVYHLKNGNKILEKTNSKTKIIIGGIILCGTIITVGSVYAYNKYVKRKETQVVEGVDFNEVLEKYITAGVQGNLNSSVITELINACMGLFRAINDDIIDLSDVEHSKINDIIDSIKQYTEKLCVINKIDEVIPQRKQSGSINDNLIELSDYLKIQKSIFDDAVNI